MVGPLVGVARRVIVQQLVKRGKSRFVKYVTDEYGQFAGGAAGVAISISVGDYYGAFTGITGNFGNNPPDRRNPPFGYLEGAQTLDGPSNGAFHQALRPTRSKKYNRRRIRRPRDSGCCCCSGQHRKLRGTRRKFR